MKKILLLLFVAMSSIALSQNTTHVTHVTSDGELIIRNDTAYVFGVKSFYIYKSFTTESKIKNMITHEYSDIDCVDVVIIIYNEERIPTHIKYDKTYYVITKTIEHGS